ncbi:probable oligoribonuclease [Episyrphus balteatus]|uniref:probable oligoribonuclease n=1 Tax=Episyrphus balteatus TaxID=286459 RepID=UPI002486596E|nr:probable oligoribonuclease [Episyrphus balteatus]
MLKSVIRTISKSANQIPLAHQIFNRNSLRYLTKFAPTTTTMGKDTWIVWMDLEMSGLDVSRDKILELSCIITDKDLNIVAEGPNIEVHQPDEVLENMNDWCMKHHAETKLIDKCRSSNISEEMAQEMLVEFLKANIPKGKCPLAGNSVYMDRLFINRYMPKVDNYLHYRIIDVSTVKELCRRWNPSVAAGAPKKKLVHRSEDDIRESIIEMKYYKKFLFK